MIEDLAAGLADLRLLILVSARAEHRRDWSTTGDATEIRLDPLSRRQRGGSARGRCWDPRPTCSRSSAAWSSSAPAATRSSSRRACRRSIENDVLVGDHGAYRLASRWRASRSPTACRRCWPPASTGSRRTARPSCRRVPPSGRTCPWRCCRWWPTRRPTRSCGDAGRPRGRRLPARQRARAGSRLLVPARHHPRRRLLDAAQGPAPRAARAHRERAGGRSTPASAAPSTSSGSPITRCAPSCGARP